MKLVGKISSLAFSFLAVAVLSCEKTEITIPPSAAHFVGDAFQIYSIITDPAPAHNVVVGATNVASSDRNSSLHHNVTNGRCRGNALYSRYTGYCHHSRGPVYSQY